LNDRICRKGLKVVHEYTGLLVEWMSSHPPSCSSLPVYSTPSRIHSSVRPSIHPSIRPSVPQIHATVSYRILYEIVKVNNTVTDYNNIFVFNNQNGLLQCLGPHKNILYRLRNCLIVYIII